MKKLITLLVCLPLVGILYFIFQNKVDPLWEETIDIVNTKNSFLPEKTDSLQLLYNDIHPTNTINAYKLINNSITKEIHWKKFNYLIRKIYQEKKVIILSTIGSGVDLVLPKIALFIAGDSKHLLEINCIESLDKNLHDQWVGMRDTKGFKPGRLLKFIEECKKTPNKNFVLLINDIDNINRATLFGSELWDNLRSYHKKETRNIEGYNYDISIPKNLHIISTATLGHFSKYPLTIKDYWKLAPKTPFKLTPDIIELKAYLAEDTPNKLSENQKLELTKQLYFFKKATNLIFEKIGKPAALGQFTRVRILLKDKNYNELIKLYLSNISSYTNEEKITEKDFKKILYTINNNGKLNNSSPIDFFFDKIFEYGIVSEFSVAFLFALFSFLKFKRNRKNRKENLNLILEELKNIEKKYLTNQINFNDAYGSFLSIKDNIHEMVKNGKLEYSHVNYLMNEMKESTETIDFINELGETNKELKRFMKIVYADDDITKQEYNDHLKFLKKQKGNIDENVYNSVMQKMTKLYHKSNLKFGRTVI